MREFTYCLVRGAHDLGFEHGVGSSDVACEIRLDTFDDFRLAKSIRGLTDVPLIATFRTRSHMGLGSQPDRQGVGWTWRMACAEAGFEFVDLEADEGDLRDKIRCVRELGSRVILSHHQSSPGLDVQEILGESHAWEHADIVKIIGTGKDMADFRRQRQAYRRWASLISDQGPPLIHFFMGDGFEATRILSLCYGAPFTFVSSGAKEPMASGQMTLEETRTAHGQFAADFSQYALFGIAGWPVSHSRSPRFHLSGLRQLDPMSLFLPFPCRNERDWNILRDTFPELRALAVTKPMKEIAFADIGSAHPRCPAINTCLFGLQPPQGRNTDFDAMRRLFADLGRHTCARVLGYGGLGKAAVHACLERGFDTQVTNRSPEKLAHLPDGATALPWTSRHSEGPTLLIQATSVGMAPNVDATPLETIPRSVTHVLESIYQPSQTVFLSQAKKLGLRIMTGTDLFRCQAELQHELFRGVLQSK